MQDALDSQSGAAGPLDALSDLAALDEYAQARVDDARAAGASWADIAKRLGVSRQTAHKRFGAKKTSKRALELRLVWERDKS
jgi:transposase